MFFPLSGLTRTQQSTRVADTIRVRGHHRHDQRGFHLSVSSSETSSFDSEGSKRKGTYRLHTCPYWSFAKADGPVTAVLRRATRVYQPDAANSPADLTLLPLSAPPPDAPRSPLLPVP